MALNYLSKLWNKKGLPVHIVFHATYRCNCRCKTCFLWENLDARGACDELSPQEIAEIRGHLGRILWLQIGGGEPFLRDDLADVCRAFGKVDTMAIPTNCLQPENIERRLKEVLEAVEAKLFLVLSLDGLQQGHDWVRGVEGNFARVKETFERARFLRRRYANFKIGINTVVTNQNQRQIPDIAGYVKETFTADMHAFEFLRGRPKSGDVLPADINKCAETVGIIKKCIHSYGYGGGARGILLKKAKLYEQDLILKTLLENKKQIDCFAGMLSAVIDPYGGVSACEMADSKLGELRGQGYDFKKVWASPQAVAVRERLQGCFCTHSCFYLINTLFDPKVLTKAVFCRT